jgi:hypothetical protein
VSPKGRPASARLEPLAQEQGQRARARHPAQRGAHRRPAGEVAAIAGFMVTALTVAVATFRKLV